MSPGRVAPAAALICLLLAGCALPEVTLRAPPVAAAERADAAHLIVVTLRNDVRAQTAHAGATPRGYEDAGQYGVTGQASRQVHALEHDYHLRSVSAWPIASLQVHCVMFRLPGGVDRTRMIAQLAQDQRVESVQPLNQFTALGSGMPSPPAPTDAAALPYNDPYAHLQGSLRQLGIVQAHQRSRGAGVRVAVIDTGLDYGHPDLQQRVIQRRNFVDDDEPAFRADVHGTEVTGVIAAVANNGIGIVGIAPEARVIALKACWQAAPDSAAVCNSFTLAQALEAALVAHADIVNMSLAGPTDPLLTRLVQAGARQGTLFVAAVPPGAARSFPADLDAVLAVEAAGPVTTPGHLAAPARDVLTLTPGGHYDFASGSSLAAAEVSGILALMLSERHHLTAGEARDILTRSIRPIVTAGGLLMSVDACAAIAPDPHSSRSTDARDLAVH